MQGKPLLKLSLKILEIAAWKRADEYCTFFASKPQVALSRIKQQMHREVGHSSMLHIVRNIRENMEFLELPGGGTHQPFSDARRGGRTPFFSLAGERCNRSTMRPTDC